MGKNGCLKGQQVTFPTKDFLLPKMRSGLTKHQAPHRSGHLTARCRSAHRITFLPAVNLTITIPLL